MCSTMDKQTNPTRLPGVLMRDAFRGLRFGARRVANVFVSANLPEPIGSAASGLLRKADKLSSEVELMSRKSIGGSFGPNALPDASLFDATGLMTSTVDVSESANAAKAGLVFALESFGETNPFISEYLCRSCMEQFKKASSDKSSAQRCVNLFNLFVDQKVCGVPPGFNVIADDKDQANIFAAYFATVLWLLVPRIEATSEEELLSHCCRVAESKKRDISLARSNAAALEQLFDYYLKII